MRDKRLVRVDLLRSLLGALVEEWGYATVRSQIDEFTLSGNQQSVGAQTPEVRGSNDERGSRTPAKPTASRLAAKISLPPGQKQLIQRLAAQYDSKQFLPTSGDIRYFFEAHGEAALPGKQRIESFRSVLKLLSVMEERKIGRAHV